MSNAAVTVDIELPHRDGASRSNSTTVNRSRDTIVRRVRLAVRLSLLANVLLFAAKLYAFIVSGSQAVLASLADSVVDILSQLVVFACDVKMRKVDPRFPIGKTKLETVGAILIACVMTLGAAQVIESSSRGLAKGIRADNPPVPDMGPWMYGILGSAVGLKAVLFVLCYTLRKESDSTMVLAEDHRNDVLSNSVAIAAAAIAVSKPRKLWWIDPVAGIVISLYIVWSWLRLARKQIDKIIGLGAPPEFVTVLENLANDHHNEMEVDVIRAYHFGHRYFVELDMITPAHKTVLESHDIAVDLQHKVESMDEVERAFVHVDYTKRNAAEHKTDWSEKPSDS